MNNTECPIIDTFGRSLIVSDSHFNSVLFRRWMLYGCETWYKTYTNADLLLAVNSILLTRLQALRRTQMSENTWCPKIHGVRSLIRHTPPRMRKSYRHQAPPPHRSFGDGGASRSGCVCKRSMQVLWQSRGAPSA